MTSNKSFANWPFWSEKIAPRSIQVFIPFSHHMGNMATSDGSEFEKWLCEKLLSVNPEVDTDVFVMYITGILDTDSPPEEKKESLSEILGEFLESENSNVCDEIIRKWDLINNSDSDTKNGSDVSDLATHLSEMLQRQEIQSVKPKATSQGDQASKQAILAQYGNISDGEEGDQEDPSGDHVASGGDPLLMKNDNAEMVNKIDKEKREKAKQEYEKKKEKDKQDREVQKQKQQERKDNEKKRTQKGERKR